MPICSRFAVPRVMRIAANAIAAPPSVSSVASSREVLRKRNVP